MIPDLRERRCVSGYSIGAPRTSARISAQHDKVQPDRQTWKTGRGEEEEMRQGKDRLARAGAAGVPGDKGSGRKRRGASLDERSHDVHGKSDSACRELETDSREDDTGTGSGGLPRLTMVRAHRLFLVRHGETEFNRIGRYQGQSNSPLTPRGVAQARRNGRALSTLIGRGDSWRVVASPLGRTMETARLICHELGFDAGLIEPEERIQEIGFGVWEGLDRAAIDALDRDAWSRRLSDPWNHVMPGGESKAAVARRVAAWLEELEGNVIAVSHGTAGRILRGLYLGLAPDEVFAQDQPQDVVFELTEGRILRH